MPTPSEKAKKCQTMTYMPNTIFSCQTTFKKAKFLEFDLKKICQPGSPGLETVAIRNPKRHMMGKASHCGSKQQ